MSQTDLDEAGYEPNEAGADMQNVQRKPGRESDGHLIFAFLSFCLALLLLVTFLHTPSGLQGLFALSGLLVFGMLGVLFLEKQFSLSVLLKVFHRQESGNEEEYSEGLAEAETEQGESEPTSTQKLTSFELLVQEALDAIPGEFREQMENLVILIESEPDGETLQQVGSERGHLLLGLYQGTPLTAQGYSRALLPARITLYQRTIEHFCHGDPGRIREQIRRTLLHEVAHHFGIDHEEMPLWIK